MKELPLIERAQTYGEATAFRSGAVTVDYATLLQRSAAVAQALLTGDKDLDQARVAFLIPGGADYATVQWGIWRAGGVAVPLCLSAAVPEWQYTLSDSQTATLVVSRSRAESIRSLAETMSVRLILIEDVPAVPAGGSLPEVDESRAAMILYTSGTTSKPKGVVSSHANIRAQIESLVAAWRWSADDRIPLFLPLHHIHGIINILSCALWSGAVIEPFERFDLAAVLKRVEQGAYSLFMAVPTIYVKLIEWLSSVSESERAAVIGGFQGMRLMISGSAALPASVHEQWTALTGQRLLERYGMTEIGMAISNPIDGERRPGSVGVALPGMSVRLKTETGEIVEDEDQSGEIQVRGPSVFSAYWNRSDVTEASFDEGWFRTGDVAVIERGYFRIMGRLSVDIIKSGGYKLSALEIEAVLLEHPVIAQCAVVGVEDDTWGEAVSAAVVLLEGATLELSELRDWCRDRMSVYKIPQRLAVLEELPRNAMGKVTKPAVSGFFGH